MGWADSYIEKLNVEGFVSFRPRGNSMKGLVESGQLCTIQKVTTQSIIIKGDIVLCKVKGSQYLHLVKAVKKSRFQIGNNFGKINGWIGLNNMYGKLVLVET